MSDWSKKRLDDYVFARKSQKELKISGKSDGIGKDFPRFFIYPFFLVHMLGFGLSGFFMAYSSGAPELSFLYMHGGFAIFVYTIFYVVFFGVDQIKWMFINAALGLFGIYSQLDLILSVFGKRAEDFSPAVHVIPFLYYVLYTFLLYQIILDITGARKSPGRKKIVEAIYVTVSILIYGTIFLSNR